MAKRSVGLAGSDGGFSGVWYDAPRIRRSSEAAKQPDLARPWLVALLVFPATHPATQEIARGFRSDLDPAPAYRAPGREQQARPWRD